METAKVQHVSKASSDELLRKFAEVDDGTPAGPSALLRHVPPIVTRKESRRTVSPLSSAGDEAARARRRRKSKGGLPERKSLLPISNRRPASLLRKMRIRRPEDGAPGIGIVLAMALEKVRTVEGASKVFVEKHCHKHVRLIGDTV
ncbi:hypothetical protein OPV22_001707 [Ensete ventricosum]|uniref:Uncharacterized protein n=1 Tax=Ensete ventricosum TaxID=4639 RepID=A0AAV8RWE6_ENSVE|nr:hypothetical protein OPV22_001707 [Ensete ventricosum]